MTGLLIFLAIIFGAPLLALLIWLIRVKMAATRATWENEEALERDRRAWRETTFEPGSFSVVLSGFRHYGAEQEVASFLGDIPELRDQSAEEIEALVERVVHVSPQAVAE